MVAATSPLANCRSRILFVTEKKRRLRLMVDSGADVSAIPATPVDRLTPHLSLILHAINHSSIRTFGQKFISLDLGLRRSFPFVFILADIPHPILGADFLHELNLHPDNRGRRLVDDTTHLWVSCSLSDSPLVHLSSPPNRTGRRSFSAT